MDKAFIFELIDTFSKSPKIDFLKIDSDGLKLELGSRFCPTEPKPSPLNSEPVQKSRTEISEVSLRAVKSPIVGTFYERSAPDAAPYVSIGQRVKKGDVLCIVEAMKMMNEIECDTEGVISEILVKNGEMVEFEQIIMRIEED